MDNKRSSRMPLKSRSEKHGQKALKAYCFVSPCPLASETYGDSQMLRTTMEVVSVSKNTTE